MSFISNIVTYTTPGTYTWMRPAGCLSIDVIVRGAGGGGASGQSGLRVGGPSGGGGARIVLPKRIPTLTAGLTYEIVVGAGGLGGATPSSSSGAWNPGGRGGDSRFDDLIAAGGYGGGWSFSADTADLLTAGDGGAFGYAGGGKGAIHGADAPNVPINLVSFLTAPAGGGGGQSYNDAAPGKGGGTGYLIGPSAGQGLFHSRFYPTLTSGGGGGGGAYTASGSTGGAGYAGGFPGGGGGGGGAAGGGLKVGGPGGHGAHGCVTVIEYIGALD